MKRSLRALALLCLTIACFSVEADDGNLLPNRLGNWQADIVEDGKVVGSRQASIENLLKGQFQSVRYRDQIGEQTQFSWFLISSSESKGTHAAYHYSTQGNHGPCEITTTENTVRLELPTNAGSYSETIAADGPNAAKLTFADGRTWQFENFQSSSFKVRQRRDSTTLLHSSHVRPLAYRIGTWHGDVLFLGRKVFESDYSFSWDLEGQIQVQHKKGGPDLMIEAWNPSSKRLESTVFGAKGEIVVRPMIITDHSAVVQSVGKQFGVEEVVEEFADGKITEVAGLKADGKPAWQITNIRKVNRLPLYLDDAAASSKPFEFSQDVSVTKDVKFNTAGPVDLKLDLVRPSDQSKKLPCVVVLHGGAWREGNKSNVHPTAALLAESGFVAAAVQYRLCPEHRFPCQVQDVKCAVRFLRAHADELKIDAENIAAMGFSAGGHLSLMLGMTDKASGLEGDGGWQDSSSRVKAVAKLLRADRVRARGWRTFGRRATRPSIADRLRFGQ